MQRFEYRFGDSNHDSNHRRFESAHPYTRGTAQRDGPTPPPPRPSSPLITASPPAGTPSPLQQGPLPPQSPSHRVDSDGFTKVTGKKINKTRVVSRGTRNNTTLNVVSKRKALFISRLSFDTSVDELSSYIDKELAIKGVDCTRLKTKVENKYASFHLSVPEESFEPLLNVELWPHGCILAPFWGSLRPGQLYVPPS